MSVAINLTFALVLAGGFMQWLPRWAPADAPDERQFSLVAGGLAANTVFGFVVLSGSAFDTYGQMGVVMLVATGLWILGRKLRPV